ncbi:MAG TPA: glucose-6-phosphate dehydrogenase assembly protein OpcA [Pyrinomonadaceae bacterium]|nr:glucose-6-phosphate dehydrogenase assembly protein OpcA [Pyrinomonadaceae bacterium]
MKSTHTTPRAVQVTETLDVQSVERELSRLWAENAGEGADEPHEEGALMRARVMNLLVYVASDEALSEVNELLSEVTGAHPCRAIVMVAEREAEDVDIEMLVSSYCRSEGSARNICGEQVTLRARGRFAVELPSAAEPLLVPDLPIFLWWRDRPRLNDEVFRRLSHASDRVVFDSADFLEPYRDLLALSALLEKERAAHTGLSDLNWARLTSWRGLLAGFYDVREYRALLDQISRVSIEYVAPEQKPQEIAPKALILAGWLTSRLGWRVAKEQRAEGGAATRTVLMERDGRAIALEFKSVERSEAMCGWIARVKLEAGDEGTSAFIVARSEDGRCLETQAHAGDERRASRLLVGGDKTEAQLLGRELEILGHDRIYEEAVRSAALLLEVLEKGN